MRSSWLSIVRLDVSKSYNTPSRFFRPRLSGSNLNRRNIAAVKETLMGANEYPPIPHNLNNEPKGNIRLEIDVPKKTQAILIEQLREIASRYNVSLIATLHFELDGSINPRMFEALQVEIQHLSRTCKAKTVMQSVYQRPGSVSAEVKTTRIVPR